MDFSVKLSWGWDAWLIINFQEKFQTTFWANFHFHFFWRRKLEDDSAFTCILQSHESSRIAKAEKLKNQALIFIITKFNKPKKLFPDQIFVNIWELKKIATVKSLDNRYKNHPRVPFSSLIHVPFQLFYPMTDSPLLAVQISNLLFVRRWLVI